LVHEIEKRITFVELKKMRKMKNQIITLLVSSFVLISGMVSCKKDNPVPDAVDPSNLSVTIEQVVNQVNVSLTADNANFYTVIFYDVDDTVYVETNNGQASYTFAQNGTYKIVSRANATHDNYIEEVNEVNHSKGLSILRINESLQCILLILSKCRHSGKKRCFSEFYRLLTPLKIKV
jgi:hypothetical protein